MVIMVLESVYPQIGVCGLSCRLCPRYHTETQSRCAGCKTESRILAGCTFITCALKKKRIEFCLECDESISCARWRNHRESGKKHDSFKCYQMLEDDIAFMINNGVKEFEEQQKIKEKLLIEMLEEFNEGKSKNYYCIATTIFDVRAIQDALIAAGKVSIGLNVKEKSKILHSFLNEIAVKKGVFIGLRR
jgi:hypothetical protein